MTELVLILILLAAVAAVVIAMKIQVRKDDADCQCCGYCTYWFQCESGSRGCCDKHSTAKVPFYTHWHDKCNHYDGFAVED